MPMVWLYLYLHNPNPSRHEKSVSYTARETTSQRKEKLMKNTISRTILSTLLICFMGTALAQDPTAEPTRKGHKQQRGNQAMPVAASMMRAIRHLDLSDEQKTDIKVIMKDLKVEERQLTRGTKPGQEQLKELIKADSFDEEAVAALAEQEGALAAERLIITSRALSEVYAQLTDEQRAELETMATQRAAKRAEKRGKRSAEGRSAEGKSTEG
jgi:protein CpxP